MPGSNSYKRKCSECQSADYCRKTFGRYWLDKSGGGVGCRFPLEARTPKGYGVVDASGNDEILNQQFKIKEGKLKL